MFIAVGNRVGEVESQLVAVTAEELEFFIKLSAVEADSNRCWKYALDAVQYVQIT